jgi:hypothetical protein
MILRSREIINEDPNLLRSCCNDGVNSESETDKSYSIFYIFKQFIMVIYNVSMFCFEYFYKGIKVIIQVSGVYLSWICLHYFASQLYVKLCVPNTIAGFLMSPFMTATPHCQGLRWVVYNAANMINNMWLILGAWICSTFLIINKDITSTSTPLS